MIAQVLSRSFLLTWLDAVEESLSDLADSGDPEGQYAAALDDIKQVKKSGVQGQEDETEGGRRSGWDDESTVDEQSFFSRDPVMSLLQSAVEELIEDKYSGLIVEDDPTDRRDAGGAVSPVTGRRLDIGDDLQFDSERRLFGPFEVTDVGWVASVGLAKALQMFRDRHPFNPRPAAPVQLADRARLVIVGDWGSGLPRAQQVAQHMRVAIDDGIADGRQVHAIHLGDVYYSGFAREYKNRFLRYWPVREDEANTVYSWSTQRQPRHVLGRPRLLQDAARRSTVRLPAAVELVLDREPTLADRRDSTRRGMKRASTTHAPNADYRTHRQRRLQSWANEDDRPFMLLSHHQLFSAYEHPGPSLRNKLAPLLDDGRIRAWLWGHEHKCVIHEPYAGVEYARCIGHGGVPVYAVGDSGVDEPRIEWVEQRAIDGLIERWALFGFAIADFDGPHVEVRYIDENNELAYEEAFDAR